MKFRESSLILRMFATVALIWLAPGAAQAADSKPAAKAPIPVVSVVEARRQEITEIVRVTGTLVPREEILVGPEIEGLRILELLVDEGDKVAKGQALARLSKDILLAQARQLDAQAARADASIEQAKAAISLAEASIAQSEPALARARSLQKTGAGTEVITEQRMSEQNANLARLNSARRGLGVSQADKVNLLAQRDELNLKIVRTEVKAPAAGLVSRRSARIGGVASMAAEPMFRIIAGGDIELEAEAPDFRMSAIRAGQSAMVYPAGDAQLKGAVRLVSPEIDRTSRLGKVRIAVGPDSQLKIGGFARGEIETRRHNGVALPASAVLYDADGAYAQTVRDGVVVTRRLSVGLVAGGFAEIVSGLDGGESVILRAGAFLREGDAVEAAAGAGAAAGTPRQVGER